MLHPVLLFFFLTERGGQTCLFGIICKGGHGLQKPELEKGMGKEDLYIKAVVGSSGSKTVAWAPLEREA